MRGSLNHSLIYLAALIFMFSNMFSQTSNEAFQIGQNQTKAISKMIYPENSYLNRKGGEEIFRVSGKKQLDSSIAQMNGNIVQKTSYSYNNQKRTAVNMIERLQNGQWHDIQKTSYEFDERGNKISALYENGTDKSWVNLSFDNYEYDSENRKVYEKSQIWFGNSWNNMVQYYYSYGINGLLDQETQQNWNSNQWANSTRLSYQYNAAGETTEIIHEKGDGSNWNYYYKYIYTYDAANNLLEMICYIYKNNNWEFNNRLVQTFDENNHILTYLNQQWKSDTWFNTYYSEYVYDNNYKHSVVTTKSISNGIFGNKDRQSDWFNEDMQRTESIYETWSSNEWKNVLSSTYQYNPAGKQTVFSQKKWVDNAWEDAFKNEITYDSDNDISTIESSVFSGGSWQPYDYYYYTESDDLGNWYQYNGGSIINYYGSFKFPEKPLLISPEDNSSLQKNSTVLKWANTLRTDSYTLQMSFYPDFSELFKEENTENKEINVDNLPPSTKFYWRVKGLNSNGEGVWSDIWSFMSDTGTDVKESFLPNEFCLFQNFPNPFNPETTIKFALPKSSHVKIAVFNLLGQKLVELVNQIYSAGYHEIMFNAANISSGVYLYKMEAENGRSIVSYTNKFILIK